MKSRALDYETVRRRAVPALQAEKRITWGYTLRIAVLLTRPPSLSQAPPSRPSTLVSSEASGRGPVGARDRDEVDGSFTVPASDDLGWRFRKQLAW